MVANNFLLEENKVGDLNSPSSSIQAFLQANKVGEFQHFCCSHLSNISKIKESYAFVARAKLKELKVKIMCIGCGMEVSTEAHCKTDNHLTIG